MKLLLPHRLLLILIAFVVLLRLLGWRPPGDRRKLQDASPDHVPDEADALVRCARCAVHLPRSLAIQNGERWYCCPEHRDAA